MLRSRLRCYFNVLGPVTTNPAVDLYFVTDFAAEKVVDGHIQFSSLGDVSDASYPTSNTPGAHAARTLVEVDTQYMKEFWK